MKLMETRPVGRPTKYKPEYCDAVIAHMSEGASLTSFAASIDVSRATINVWMQEYPEFLEAAMTAKSKCASWWEAVGRKNAVEGGGNATLVVFGLKNMAADDWRDKREVDHQSSDGTMSPTRIEIVAGDNGTDSAT
jgi:transposase